MVFFSGLLKTTLNTVTLPLDVVKSVVDKNAIDDKVDRIEDNIEEMFEDF